MEHANCRRLEIFAINERRKIEKKKRYWGMLILISLSFILLTSF